MVDAHRRAKIGHTPPGRSSATPSTARGSVTPVPAGHHPPTMPRIPSFSLPDSAETFSLEPHMLSATDAFPDGTLAQLRSQPMRDSNFSDIEDADSSDDSAFYFSAPAALADDAAMIPATTASTAAGRPSAFLLNTYSRRCHLRMAEAGAPALAHGEPITTVPDGRAPSGASRPHRGSGLTSAASAHHPQVTEATTPTLAPSEPITAVSAGRLLSTAGTSHQGADPAPTADPLNVAEAAAPTLAPSEPITAVSDVHPLSTAGTSHQGADPAPTAKPIEELVLAAARPPTSR